MQKIWLLLIFLSCGLLCCTHMIHATLILDDLIHQMTPEDLIQTGLDKLTDEEKAYFHFWLQYKASTYSVDLSKESTPSRTSCFKTDVFWGNQSTPDDPVDESTLQWDLALCSPFQHDAQYLKEWIEYHKLVGVQHFYLYNNLSNDHYLSVLKEYIDRGEVELIEFPTPTDHYDYLSGQARCYTDALNRAWGKARWLIIADSDLFFIPVVNKDLITFLSDYEEFGGVTVNLYNYGTSHVYSLAPGELMTEKLIKRAPLIDRYIKSIVKPHRTAKIHDAYCAIYKPGFFAVDENFQRVDIFLNSFASAEKIRINHYEVRTLEFLYQVSLLRHLRFDAQCRKEPLPLTLPEELSLEFHDAEAEEEGYPEIDTIMERFVPELKERMQN